MSTSSNYQLDLKAAWCNYQLVQVKVIIMKVKSGKESSEKLKAADKWLWSLMKKEEEGMKRFLNLYANEMYLDRKSFSQIASEYKRKLSCGYKKLENGNICATFYVDSGQLGCNTVLRANITSGDRNILTQGPAIELKMPISVVNSETGAYVQNCADLTSALQNLDHSSVPQKTLQKRFRSQKLFPYGSRVLKVSSARNGFLTEKRTKDRWIIHFPKNCSVMRIVCSRNRIQDRDAHGEISSSCVKNSCHLHFKTMNELAPDHAGKDNAKRSNEVANVSVTSYHSGEIFIKRPRFTNFVSLSVEWSGVALFYSLVCQAWNGLVSALTPFVSVEQQHPQQSETSGGSNNSVDSEVNENNGSSAGDNDESDPNNALNNTTSTGHQISSQDGDDSNTSVENENPLDWFRPGLGVQGKYAIISGISDYKNISDLSYCDEDATDWYNYLKRLGYQCRVIRRQPHDELSETRRSCDC